MENHSFPENLFIEYAEKLKIYVSLIEGFRLPQKQSWKIDWNVISELSSISQSKKPWNKISIYEHIKGNKNHPAVYYFTIDSTHSQKVFECFTKSKKESSLLRREKGVKNTEFRNISHVRAKFSSGNCLYVGSTKNNIHERFKQHLGFSSGRTGALYLSKVLKDELLKPDIEFHYYILDEKYRQVTEHIEKVLQEQLNPFIGKK